MDNNHAGLAQAIDGTAARHPTVRPIAEPLAGNHEVIALRFGLKSEDAASSLVSPTYTRFHDATFSVCVASRSYHDLRSDAAAWRSVALDRLTTLAVGPTFLSRTSAASDASCLTQA
jgi:hypothetical protein